MAWRVRVHAHADYTAIVTFVLVVFLSEQIVEFGVERGCVHPEEVRGVEDPECLFTSESAGEEEWWFWNAVL